jgi:hypothetical protein
LQTAEMGDRWNRLKPVCILRSSLPFQHGLSFFALMEY